MDRHEQFKRLFKKFIDGMRWLNTRMQEGTATGTDKQEFNEQVVKPMDALWDTMTDDEKQYWGMVQHGVDLFGGTILLEDEKVMRRVKKKKGQKKKWRRYFQSH